MNYILTAERLGIEKSMWGFGTFHSVARQLLCKYLPEKCTVEGTDRAVNQNETTDWNREFEVIESEEEMQMLLDWEEKPGSEERKANLQSLRRQAVETIRRKSAEENMAETEPVKQEERQTETESVKQEERHTNTEERVVRRGRHSKYGEGIITSEDDMTIEMEFPGYGKKQFLKAFGEIEVL